MKDAIIDASVILKWYLPDEVYATAALTLLERYVSGLITLEAPSLLEYEVINGLIMAWRRGRVKEEKLSLAIEGFFDLGISLQAITPIYPLVLRYCGRYGCSAYDAAYLALAAHKGRQLITADERLYRLTANDLQWVRWLGDQQLFRD